MASPGGNAPRAAGQKYPRAAASLQAAFLLPGLPKRPVWACTENANYNCYFFVLHGARFMV
jgi:hypothetical protein